MHQDRWAQFRPFRYDSGISRFNRGKVLEKELSPHVLEIFALCERSKQETASYFDITRPDGTIDPCGMVKGWAINNAARQLSSMGFPNFCVAADRDNPKNSASAMPLPSSGRFAKEEAHS